MSIELIVLTTAQADLDESYLWYENRTDGLGHEFLHSVEEVIDLIKGNPVLFPAKYKEIHIAQVSTFPFTVSYVIVNSIVRVFAVLHTSRNFDIVKEREIQIPRS